MQRKGARSCPPHLTARRESRRPAISRCDLIGASGVVSGLDRNAITSQVCCVNIQEILQSVDQLSATISDAPAGAPALNGVIARIRQLQAEVEKTRGAQGALIPDTARAPTANEESLAGLDRALRSLLDAATSKL